METIRYLVLRNSCLLFLDKFNKRKGENTLKIVERKEADMHTHSTYSDGRNGVIELAGLVKKANLKVAVLTDHDRTGGLKEFIDSCANNGIDSMTGIEISSTDTTLHPQTIDVLGYGFNVEILLRDYNDLLEHNLNARIKYIKEVLELFGKKGVANFTLITENFVELRS